MIKKNKPQTIPPLAASTKMCVAIIPICPCGDDGQLGATLPCIKAFAADRKFRYRAHHQELWHRHFDKCDDCWTWWESEQLRGVPTPACTAREYDFQEAKYLVFCRWVYKKVKIESCCEDCCGPNCRTGSGKGTVLQETSAAPSSQSTTSTNGVDAAITTTTDKSAESSGSGCDGPFTQHRLPSTPTSGQSFTGGIAYPPTTSGKSDRSNNSDGSSEMSHESKGRSRKGGLFCRAVASIKRLRVSKTAGERRRGT